MLKLLLCVVVEREELWHVAKAEYFSPECCSYLCYIRGDVMCSYHKIAKPC